MPKIQLIRRDGGVVELEATNIGLSVQRNLTGPYPVPLLATRAALDLNQPSVSITVEGVIADDETAIPGVSSKMSIDLSLSFGSAGATSFCGAISTVWGSIISEMDGATITFRTKGQIDAGLGEKTQLHIKNGSASNVVATTSIIYADISSTTNTNTLSTAIQSALNAASIKVNGATVAFTTECTVSAKAGQAAAISYFHQNGSAGTYNNELIEIANDATGSSGDSTVVVEKTTTSSSISWNKQFFVSDMQGGVNDVKQTRGDKLQDLLNMITNPSVGGGLISPQTLTGSMIELPSSIASVDSAQFLNIGESKAVKKYIVGIRIPYESLASSTTGGRELRQFLIPAGPGTDVSAESNTEVFDPYETVNNKKSRPNPFNNQGIAIPAIVSTFDPGYEAGDSVWTYTLTMLPVEQLIGL